MANSLLSNDMGLPVSSTAMVGVPFIKHFIRDWRAPSSLTVHITGQPTTTGLETPPAVGSWSLNLLVDLGQNMY